ncbi:MAG TPA: STAS domain-containing protein [Candidatus Baltobacteraceae bacterium]|jgi:anti-anti-sigma factor|nr:STAS domain-containing protein [Candidatus Baltobacteraceae bacterium]
MAHIVVFAGEYDLANKKELQKELSRLNSVEELVLDLSEVTYIDSTFLSDLISLEKTRRKKRLSSVTVIAPPKCLVRKLFQVTGMMSLLNVVESYSGAASTIEYADLEPLPVSLGQ